MASDFLKNVAAPEPGLGEAEVQLKRSVKRGERLLEAP